MTTANNPSTIIVQTGAGKTVKTIVANKAVLTAKAGEHYSVVNQNNGQHLDNLIATKVGNNLILDYANGVQVTIEDYFSVCENDECSVTVVGEDAAGYQIAAKAEGATVDGSSLLYARGDSATLMAMTKHNDAMNKALSAEFDDLSAASVTWLPPQATGSAFWANAAGGLAILGAGGVIIHQALDNTVEPTTIQGNISPGPVLATNGLTVTAYQANGKVLGSSSVEAGSISFSITYTDDYTGPILVRITDANTGADYYHQATAAPKDLSTDLRAVAGPNTYVVNINPLTELAVRELGLAADDNALEPITATAISAANQNVAAAFGLNDIVSAAVTLNDQAGATTANDYGIILAAISGIEQRLSTDTDAVLASLADGLNADQLSVQAIAAVVAALHQANLLDALSAESSQRLSVDADSLSELTPAQLAELPEAFIATLAPEVLAALSEAQIAALNVVFIEGSIVAGPVQLGHGLVVMAYAEDGSELATGSINDDGSFNIVITQDYYGQMLVRVADTSDGTDYLDEGTGAAKDLTTDLRAAAVIEGFGTYTLNITPLTELAVRELLADSGADAGTTSVDLSGVTPDDVSTTNQAVANIFGIADIVTTTPAAVNDNAAHAAATEAQQDYGHVLAALSGLEQTGDYENTDAALDALADSIAAGELTADDLDDLRDAAAIVESVDGNTEGTTDIFNAITISPTVAITLNTARLIAGQTATVTFAFSEAPTDFTAADITAGSGAISALAVNENDPTIYTAMFTPTADIEATENVITVGSGYTNAAGNVGTAGSSANYAVDTVAPTLAITLSDTSLIADETATVTFDFSEAVQDFTAEDIRASYGAISDLRVDDNDATIYTARFTPSVNTGPNVNNIVVSASYTDTAGNAGTSGSSELYEVDTLAPTLTITLDTTTLNTDETATVTFNFSEAPTDFTVDDITAGSGTISDLEVDPSDATIYTAIFTPTDGVEAATNVIAVGPGYTDARGNTGTFSQSENYAVNTVAVAGPTVAITSNMDALKINEEATITFTFSEAPLDFVRADVAVTGGTLSDITVDAMDDKVYTAMFIPATRSTATPSITIATGAYTDAEGNLGAAGTSPVIAVDTIAPTVVITIDDTTLIADETTTVTFDFSEVVEGFTVDDILAGSGAISDLEVDSVDQTIYTARFTPRVNAGPLATGLTVSSTYTDTAGNAGTSGSSELYEVDTLAPTLTITLDATTINTDETATVTFDFSEAPTDFTVDDITAGSGTISDLEVDPSDATIYTAIFTPTDGVEAATNVIVVGSGYTDFYGNMGTPNQSDNYAVNTVAVAGPTVAITSNMDALKINEEATITFTFSEAPLDFVRADVAVTGGILSDITVDAMDDKVYTAMFIPAAGSTATPSITIAAGAYTDAEGNLGAAGTSPVIAVDTVAPTVSIVLSDTTIIADETATVTFDFSEAVEGFTVDDIHAGGGAISDLEVDSVDQTIYTARFTPAVNYFGVEGIRVPNSTYTDAAGNAGMGGSSDIVVIDTRAPTVSITLDATTIIADETATVTFDFSEAPTDFTVDDITAGSGTISDLEVDPSDATIYTAIFTPTDGVEAATNVIAVGPGYTDFYGNTGTPNQSDNYAVNTVAVAGPTVAITSNMDALKINEEATITFTFSEAPLDFVRADVAVTGGILSDITVDAMDDKVYTAMFIPATRSTATPSITIATGAYTDAEGNLGAAGTSPVIAVDTIAPTVTITLDDPTLTIGETATVTFSFSEAVQGFTAEDIGRTGGGVISGLEVDEFDATIYTAKFTPETDFENNIEGTNTGVVVGSGYTDAAGNAGTVGAGIYVVDTLAPTVTITLDTTTLNANETATVTFDFSEAVQDFTAADIAADSGTISNLEVDPSDATIYTAIFTPTDGVEAATNVIAVGPGYTDAYGNTGTPNQSDNYAVNTVTVAGPTVAITSNMDALKINEEATITFTFSEAPLDFARADVAVTGGILSDITVDAMDDKVYTAMFIPATRSTATPSITIATGAYTDAEGNPGAAGTSPVITVDTIAPTVVITIDDRTIIANETATVTFDFSEVVEGFTVDDIGVGSGAISDLEVDNSDPTIYTARFTPPTDFESTGNAISVSPGSYEDAAGNAGAFGLFPMRYTVDTLAPTVTITLSDTTINADETATVTFDFSEAVQDFTAADIAADSGTISNLEVDPSDATIYTAIFTPTDGVEAATNVIAVGPGYTDARGNTGTPNQSDNYAVNTVAVAGPTVAITSNMDALKINEEATITFTFSEAPLDFVRADVAVTGGILSDITVDAMDDKVYTAMFIPATRSTATPSITIATGAYTDAEGNPGAAGTSPVIAVDTIAPTVSIVLSDTTIIADETATVTFDFSEVVEGFTVDDIGVGSGAISDLEVDDSDPTIYTATFTPLTDFERTGNAISVSPGSYEDAAGNAGTFGLFPVPYTVDTQAPTVTITLSDTTIIADETATVTFSFSETVQGFTVDDVRRSSGTIGELTELDPSTYTAKFTPTAGVESMGNAIVVDEGGYEDAAGNEGTLGLSRPYRVDTVAPTVTITLSDTTIIADETATVTFIFSEAVQDFTAADIAVDSGTISDLEVDPSDATIYTARFTPTDGVEAATNVIAVGPGYTDAYGNTGTFSQSDNYAVNTVAVAGPTVAITSNMDALKINEEATITFTFSEAPLDFVRADVAVTGGTLSDITIDAMDDKVYTAMFIPAAASTATPSITIAAGAYTDAEGNPGTAGTSPVIAVDTIFPTVSIMLSDTTINADETATVTFSFSEAVQGFTVDDIDAGSGTISDLEVDPSDATIYTAIFTPRVNTGPNFNNIFVPAGSYTDAAGNAGDFGFFGSYTVDTVAPTVTITLDDTIIIAGETPTVTFSFSEAVQGFTVDDVRRSSGTIGELTELDPSTYTAKFTPTAGVESMGNAIVVDEGSYEDAAGNEGTLGLSRPYRVDTVAPTVTITLSDTTIIADETATVTFIFSEAVQDFTAADIAADSGTISNLEVDPSDATIYTAIFTPTDGVEAATNVITVGSGYTDAYGNTGTPNQSDNYAVNTVTVAGPTVAITSNMDALKINEEATITFTFSEAPLDFARADVAVTGGILSDITVDAMDDKVYTAMFIPATRSTATPSITIATGAYTDAAGNLGAAGTSPVITVDTIAPTVTITLSDTTIIANETATVTFNFSEAVRGFTADGVSSGSGAIGVLTELDPSTYTATFTPATDVESMGNAITVSPGSYEDAAGNAGALGFSLPYRVDTFAPTVSITLDATLLNAGQTATVTFSFSEAVQDFTVEDIDADNGAISGLEVDESDATIYTARFTPTANVEALTNVITVSADSYTDALGNEGMAGSSDNYAVNTVAVAGPTVAITSNMDALKINEEATITFTFSEAPLDFVRADVAVTGGTLSDITVDAMDDKVYTAMFIPAARSTATPSITIAAGAYTDAAGNLGAAGTSPVITVDTVAPTVTIVLSDTTIIAGETATVTFDFSEAVQGFTADDIRADGGVISNLMVDSADSTIYTARFTPEVNYSNLGDFYISGSTYTDAAGNAGTSAHSDDLIITIDTRVPTVTITLDATTLNTDETATVTFSFSEAVQDFTVDDITADSGTISDLEVDPSDATIYTAKFTPTDGVEAATNVITVSAGSYTDRRGNTGTPGSSANYAVNTVGPTDAGDPPAFTNAITTVYVAENVATASAVYDAQAAAYLGSGTNDTDITYTLSGTDAGAFNIDTATGELRFVAVPDFETPADANTDNSYELSITATHTPSGQSVDQAVTINVLNQNVHGAQLTAYTRTTADSTPVLEGTGPAGATITVGLAGASYEVVANRFGSWRIDTETATPTSGSLTIDLANGAAGTWNAITLSATVEGETLNSVSGITIDTDASATDASAFHLQTYADGTASADGTANDIDYRSYNGVRSSTQNAILIGKSELEYMSNAALIALGEAGIAALTWEQVASLSPEQLRALHDENLLDNFNFGSGDKPSMILNAITGTDIISEQEMAGGFTVKIDGSGFANATVKLLLDNDRGSWDAPADEATALAHYTVIGEGTADASGHLDFIFTNGADDGDNTNITIGTDVLSGGSLTKKFTVWNDLNDDGIIDIDAGETAERVFYTADGTASMEDAIANPGINYSILDPITHQAFVYFYGDIDHGPQNGVGRDDMDGFMSYSNTASDDEDSGWRKGISGNFAADLYEFHANSLASESAETADWQTSQDRANDQNAGGLLATSASARALSFEQLGAFIAANFSNNAAGSNPDVLDYIRDDAGLNFSGNVENEDDISGLAGADWQGSSIWSDSVYWNGTATPSGHAIVDLTNGRAIDFEDYIVRVVANVL